MKDASLRLVLAFLFGMCAAAGIATWSYGYPPFTKSVLRINGGETVLAVDPLYQEPVAILHHESAVGFGDHLGVAVWGYVENANFDICQHTASNQYLFGANRYAKCILYTPRPSWGQ